MTSSTAITVVTTVVYCTLVIHQGSQFGPLWTASPANWPFLLALMYPVGDHWADHRAWLRLLGSPRQEAVGLVFYALHVYYYCLVKNFYDCECQGTFRTKIKKIPGKDW